ncbi:hypothetical protein GX50_04120 [[Emmonsia] crescens]|uniref:Uncharacterized protein n=1 Tax=[Emmonsia] crescens TaxID=73230 RepID=A0A2B7ZGD3_9EURO|nr:hypothetical protein GX50_04120 [Emmonsia crescens]
MNTEIPTGANKALQTVPHRSLTAALVVTRGEVSILPRFTPTPPPFCDANSTSCRELLANVQTQDFQHHSISNDLGSLPPQWPFSQCLPRRAVDQPTSQTTLVTAEVTARVIVICFSYPRRQ